MRRTSKWVKYRSRRNYIAAGFYLSYFLAIVLSKNKVCYLLLMYYFPFVAVLGFIRWRICPVEVLARTPIRGIVVVWRRLYGRRRWWAALLYVGYVVLLLLTFVIR